MNKYLFILNIFGTVFEALICALGIVGFVFLARYFNRWWIGLFALIPLIGYNGWKFVAEDKENDNG